MKSLKIKQRWGRVVSTFKSLLFDPDRLEHVGYVLLFIEFVLNIFIINRVNYTEIDWKAYMQEVEGVLNGTMDYDHLKGDTGPLVYPAGFVYIFSFFYFITSSGRNIRLAQYIFCVIYILMLHVVFRLYGRSRKVPPYVLILMCASSYRIHSIFVLRMFNDAIAMFLLYLTLALFCRRYWQLGCFVYSAAVSVKMNILLFAPALFFILLSTNGYQKTAVNLAICAAVQLVLALPFLLENPTSYIINSFNLGRVFEYQWTVNWRCIPEDLFVNKSFHITLLSLHVIALLIFLPKFISYTRINKVNTSGGPVLVFIPDQILLPMFASNFIGIVFARSLHYQFYVWYYHSIPYLLWSLPLTPLAKLLLWGTIEMCWNTYPSTALSSVMLHCCHLIVLSALFYFWPLQAKVVIRQKNKSD